MGKRSDFERIERDYYRTWDPKAVAALAPFLNPGDRFVEPCAGDNVLTEQIEELGLIWAGSYDIEPQADFVEEMDALMLQKHHLNNADVIITNPPWERKLLHQFIEVFANLRTTWLLFDSDWAYTKQAKTLLNAYCTDIVVIGRLKWIEDSKMSGKDNCAWYRFTNQKTGGINFHNK